MFAHRRPSLPIHLSMIAQAGLLLACSACSAPADVPLPRQTDTPLNAVRVPIPATETTPAAPTTDAPERWTMNGDVALYGTPGNIELELACQGDMLVITRPIPAEVGASALFALQGPRHIVRLSVDATPWPGRRGYRWQGMIPADDPRADVFTGAFNGTLPGAGLIKVGPGEPPRTVIHRCRAHGKPA